MSLSALSKICPSKKCPSEMRPSKKRRGAMFSPLPVNLELCSKSETVKLRRPRCLHFFTFVGDVGDERMALMSATKDFNFFDLCQLN